MTATVTAWISRFRVAPQHRDADQCAIGLPAIAEELFRLIPIDFRRSVRTTSGLPQPICQNRNVCRASNGKQRGSGNFTRLGLVCLCSLLRHWGTLLIFSRIRQRPDLLKGAGPIKQTSNYRLLLRITRWLHARQSVIREFCVRIPVNHPEFPRISSCSCFRPVTLVNSCLLTRVAGRLLSSVLCWSLCMGSD
jgi:hypothetical protein